jgi:hypothetical protein
VWINWWSICESLFLRRGTLTGKRYLDFLVNQLPLLLENVLLTTQKSMYFQQDGAPAHNAIIVKQYLNDFS